MPKRIRAVPLSFPTIFFACLLLTTCVHGQQRYAFHAEDLSAETPIRVLQLLLEKQQTILDTPASTQAERDGTSSRPIPYAVFAASGIARSNRPADTHKIFESTSVQQRQITPAQYFGIGAQSAP